MDRRIRKLTAGFTALSFCVIAGCVGVGFKGSPGVPLDSSKVAQIQPGITTFSEILAWFGPPDLIVDGTQRMVDFVTLRPPYRLPIATRLLTAPEGMVILIYMKGEGKYSQFTVVNVADPEQSVDQRYEEAHTDDLFIYLSKKDRKVVTIAGP